MDVYEITGYQTGVDRSGVNFLEPKDSFEQIQDGYIYRQVLQSRYGFTYFAPRLANNSRIHGIFEFIKPDGTADLLAIDTNFLYKFNTATGVFDQISFGGSLTPGGNDYAGFDISAKDFYISGCAYPTKENNQRFIFCGRGINNQLPDTTPIDSTIFFYNGTDVRCFTNTTDNPDYAAPTMGALTSAKYVLYFNERLNFFSPPRS